MNAVSIALQHSAHRLKKPSVVAGVLAGLGFAVVVALLERRTGPGAADRSLTGAAFGLVLPLVAWCVVQKSCLGTRLELAFADLARHGADRRWLALGQLVAAAVVCAGVGVCLGGFGVLAARGTKDPIILTDMWASVSVGALAGAAYACWFTLGSAFGKQGGGRTAFLGLDWFFGSTASALALAFPRGHIQNLLGASAPLGASQAASGVWLIMLSFSCVALAIYRIPR